MISLRAAFFLPFSPFLVLPVLLSFSLQGDLFFFSAVCTVNRSVAMHVMPFTYLSRFLSTMLRRIVGKSCTKNILYFY